MAVLLVALNKSTTDRTTNVEHFSVGASLFGRNTYGLWLYLMVLITFLIYLAAITFLAIHHNSLKHYDIGASDNSSQAVLFGKRHLTKQVPIVTLSNAFQMFPLAQYNNVYFKVLFHWRSYGNFIDKNSLNIKLRNIIY